MTSSDVGFIPLLATCTKPAPLVGNTLPHPPPKSVRVSERNRIQARRTKATVQAEQDSSTHPSSNGHPTFFGEDYVQALQTSSATTDLFSIRPFRDCASCSERARARWECTNHEADLPSSQQQSSSPTAASSSTSTLDQAAPTGPGKSEDAPRGQLLLSPASPRSRCLLTRLILIR